ncbi:uncharacterized protein PHALS_01483 [Plasmopara halstedii]|uniref:Transmembrane protein, putative n=1 Tax=Plasmopara halstedii TaxID=4781 RepID=A0A0P1AUP3_PLAHL|nr:uncharacterized protein PHALS_01483 [Plasmopara halstedii]CEG45166.1 transmembrane protein, putative [Plasmopara halstedii]|eukprot:XP_024581535.1 transmembrane protein, putative [Plasmopara halstedii]
MASLSVSSGIWLKSCSSLSVASSNYALSLSIDSLPPELFDDPLTLQNAVPLDLQQRQGYGALKLEQNGALRPGGQVALMTRRTVGLIVNYVAFGALCGGLNSLNIPLFSHYLQLQQYQIRAASMILNTAWMFKAFGGFLTDNLNICGYRRKPLLISGWVLCLASLLCLGTSGMPHPGEAEAAWRYLTFMLFGSIGYFLANSAADAIVVEIAQREPLSIRGHTQVSVFAARMFGAIIMNIFVTGTLNGSAYGGSFSWSFNVNQVLLVMSTCPVISLVSSIWFLYEKPTRQAVPMFACSEERSRSAAFGYQQQNPSSFDQSMGLGKRCQLIWRLIQSRVMWQLLMFELMTSFCSAIDSSAVPAIEANWVNMAAWPRSIAFAVWCLAFIAGLFAIQRFLLQKPWRYLYCIATVWVVGIDIVTVACTVFNVLRNRSFWLYMRVLAAPAVALRFIVQLLPIVELAPREIEGTTYGLVITFRHMAIPLGVTAYNTIGSYFSVSQEDVHRDSGATRVQVTFTYLIAWTFQLISIAFLGLLPRQKLEVQQLRYYGGYSIFGGWLVVVVLFSVLTYETIASVLSLFESTSCLRMTGGTGCGK